MGGTGSPSDSLMNAAWTVSTLFHVLLLSVSCVQAKPPNLIPASCTHLQPLPCTYVHSVGPQGFDMKYYYENCENHGCIGVGIDAYQAVAPGLSPYYNDELDTVKFLSHHETFPYVEQLFYDHYSQTRFTRPLKGNRSLAKFLDPSLFRVDREGRFLRKSNFWFCSDDVLNYRARVELNTGLIPGQKEDMFVHCEWLRMESFLGLTNCDTQSRPCEDCLDAYRYYLCAMYFPKCQESASGSVQAKTNESVSGTEEIYASANISDLVEVDYIVTKPCRGLCWDVSRKCTYFVGIKCHRYESREYGDLPNCNWAGNEDVKLIKM